MASDKGTDEEFWEYYAYNNNLDFPERDAAIYIDTYVPPFLLVIGTFGNIIAAVILRKMADRVLSTCLYLFVIVLVDLLVLYVLCGNVWFLHMTGIDIKQVAMLSSNSACKIYPFISDLVLHLTVWLAVAMATETTIVTMRPPRLIRMCNLERARAVILLIVVLLVCVNAHCFWTFALVKVEKTTLKQTVCTKAKQGNQSSEEFRKIVWPIIDILVADLLPYCILFSCSVILITKRCKRRDQIRELETVWKSFSLDSESAKQFHLSFLTICVAYLLLLLPKLANNIFHFLVDTEGLSLVEYTLVLDSKMQLTDCICSMLLYVFVSCKFFLLLASSCRFRQEFVSLMTCKRCCPRQTSVNGRTPVVKSSHQPLLNQANNIDHSATTSTCKIQQQHDPQIPQQEMIVCQQMNSHPNHTQTEEEKWSNANSPRKQIYSMTSV